MLSNRFTDKELKKLKDGFNKFDINNDQLIDFKEFTKMMKEQGMHLPKEQLKFCFGLADKDKSGTIDFEEYTHLAHMGTYPQDETAKAKMVFDSFDNDGNGTIDNGELKAALHKMGMDGLDDGDIKDIVNDFDKNGNGVLDFIEFFSLLQVLQEQLGDVEI